VDGPVDKRLGCPQRRGFPRFVHRRPQVIHRLSPDLLPNLWTDTTAFPTGISTDLERLSTELQGLSTLDPQEDSWNFLCPHQSTGRPQAIHRDLHRLLWTHKLTETPDTSRRPARRAPPSRSWRRFTERFAAAPYRPCRVRHRHFPVAPYADDDPSPFYTDSGSSPLQTAHLPLHRRWPIYYNETLADHRR
jgi:hypothetical protein